MRLLIVSLLALIALWRGCLDVRAMIQNGTPFRFESAGELFRSATPHFYHDIALGLQRGGLDGVHEFIFGGLLGVPAVVLLLFLALVIWLRRPLEPGRG